MEKKTVNSKSVASFNEFVIALQDKVHEINITRSFLCNYSVILPEGTALKGKPQENGELPLLSFHSGDGIGLTANNTIRNLHICAKPAQKAIFSAFTGSDLGHFNFENLVLTGQFSFITRAGNDRAKIDVDGMDIVSADATHYIEQPQKYGVNVLQGVFTVYNLNSSEDSRIELTAKNISIGRKSAPVSGSGIFIAGFGDNGGKTIVERLHTKAIYSNSKIPYGVATYITAGVFILNGVVAKEVVLDGETVTYGINDMVLDVWGEVHNWTCNAPVISYGPSGIGFVNFGYVKNFVANAPFETYGQGSRGYNQYDGTVDTIVFHSISTYGDGAVAIQIGKKIGTLTVTGDISTHGAIGNSLVKGVIVSLPAWALSIKDGGEADAISVKGNIETYGDGVSAFIVAKGGKIHRMKVGGKVITHGDKAKPIQIENGGEAPIQDIRTESK